jgi:predicted transport protein
MSFVRLEFGKTYINVLLRDPKYTDPKEIIKDITSYKYGYKGQAKIKSLNDVDYIFDLIRQSYESTL